MMKIVALALLASLAAAGHDHKAASPAADVPNHKKQTDHMVGQKHIEHVGQKHIEHAVRQKHIDHTVGQKHTDHAVGHKHTDKTVGQKHIDKAVGQKHPDHAVGLKQPDDAVGQKHTNPTAGQKHTNPAVDQKHTEKLAGQKHTDNIIKFSKKMTTPDGIEVGSDRDLEKEIGKMMAQYADEDKRRKAYESVHGPGSFKEYIPLHGLAQGDRSHHLNQGAHKVSLVAKSQQPSGIGSDSDMRREVDKLLREEVGSDRVERHRTNSTLKGTEAESLLSLERQRRHKRKSHGAGGAVSEERDTSKRSYADLSRERGFQARRSRHSGKHLHSAANEQRHDAQSRDRRLLHELVAVRRDLVRGLHDGSNIGDRAARTENRLIREAERVLKEAHLARKREMHVAALDQHGSRIKQAHSQHRSVASMAQRGATEALRASKEAANEEHRTKAILHETRFAEREISKLLEGEGAEKIRKLVMKDLERARRAETRAIKAEKKEAVGSRRAASHLAKEARHMAAYHKQEA